MQYSFKVHWAISMFLGQSGIKNFKSVQYICLLKAESLCEDFHVKKLSVSSMLSSLRLA